MFKTALFIILTLPGMLLAECLELNKAELQKIFTHVLLNYADIQIAEAGAQNARLEMQKALSEFDPILSIENNGYKDSYYDGRSNSIKVRKLNQFLGSNIELGYRRGTGDFAVYEDYYSTTDHGETFTAITIPLLRNLKTDRNRTARDIAGIKINLAETEIFAEKQKVLAIFLNFMAEVINARYNANTLKQLNQNLAEQRRITTERVTAGSQPRNDLLEIDRFILRNKNQSLYYDNILSKSVNYINQVFLDGSQLALKACQLDIKNPLKFANHYDNVSLYEQAIKLRPDLNILRQAAEVVRREIDLANNQSLPNLNLRLEYDNGLGSGDPEYSRDNLRGLITFEFPFFNRFANSEISEQQNNLVRLQSKLKNLENIVKSKIYDFVRDLDTGSRQIGNYAEEINLMQRLVSADYESFHLGNRDLFQINLRENQLLGVGIEANRAYADLLRKDAELLLFVNDFDSASEKFSAQLLTN